jgi:hypothetical protein
MIIKLSLTQYMLECNIEYDLAYLVLILFGLKKYKYKKIKNKTIKVYTLKENNKTMIYNMIIYY